MRQLCYRPKRTRWWGGAAEPSYEKAVAPPSGPLSSYRNAGGIAFRTVAGKLVVVCVVQISVVVIAVPPLLSESSLHLLLRWCSLFGWWWWWSGGKLLLLYLLEKVSVSREDGRGGGRRRGIHVSLLDLEHCTSLSRPCRTVHTLCEIEMQERRFSTFQ